MAVSPKYTLVRIEAACRAAGIREIDIKRLRDALETTTGPVGRPRELSDQEKRKLEGQRLEKMAREVAIERNSLTGYFMYWWYVRKIRSSLSGTGSSSPESGSNSEDTEPT